MCLGEEARQHLEELILGKRVRLADQAKGRFDRVISLVYHDKAFVNKVMLEEGYGRYDSTGTSKDQELRQVANKTKKDNIGIHSEKRTQSKPPNSKCAIKGNIDKLYREKVYHFKGCSG